LLLKAGFPHVELDQLDGHEDLLEARQTQVRGLGGLKLVSCNAEAQVVCTQGGEYK